MIYSLSGGIALREGGKGRTREILLSSREKGVSLGGTALLRGGGALAFLLPECGRKGGVSKRKKRPFFKPEGVQSESFFLTGERKKGSALSLFPSGPPF